MHHPDVSIRRVYELPEHKKGKWILIDRLWPRGIKKEELDIDEWMKDIAPSSSLRKWFNHDPDKWTEFRQRYIQELKDKKELIKDILEKAEKSKKITLLYAAKDPEHNHALVLQAFLQSWPNEPDF